MAHTVISVTNGVEIKKVPLGFSWTTFFFAGFPALFRGDWIPGIIITVLSFFTWGVAGAIAAFIYNKMYAKSLFEKGYRVHAMPPGCTEETVCADLGYIKFPNQI
jgi:hypothetical protein